MLEYDFNKKENICDINTLTQVVYNFLSNEDNNFQFEGHHLRVNSHIVHLFDDLYGKLYYHHVKEGAKISLYKLMRCIWRHVMVYVPFQKDKSMETYSIDKYLDSSSSKDMMLIDIKSSRTPDGYKIDDTLSKFLCLRGHTCSRRRGYDNRVEMEPEDINAAIWAYIDIMDVQHTPTSFTLNDELAHLLKREPGTVLQFVEFAHLMNGFINNHPEEEDNFCLSGETQLLTETGYKALKEITKGDNIAVDGGGYAEVLCKTVSKGRVPTYQVLHDGPRVTINHPLIVNSRWTTINKLVNEEGYSPASKFERVYNLVFKANAPSHIYTASGYKTIGLGHNSSDPHLFHELYGSHKAIVKYLSTKSGFDDGEVTL